MKLLLKMGKQSDIFQSAYANFSRRCLRPNPEILSAKSDYIEIRDMFVHGGMVEDFCNRTVKLSDELKLNGNGRLSDLLINELSKLCVNFNMHAKAEELLHIALENSRKKNDGLHELARLTDLEYLYKNLNYRKDLFNIRKQKKECCKRVIADYEQNVKNYDSILKKPTPKEGVQTQLAFTYSDLAHMLERRKPQDAVNLYTKSKNIYEGLGKERETAYLTERIRRLQERYNKLALNT